MAPSGQVRWRRRLRLGCVGIAVVVALVVVVAAGIAIVQIRSTRIESRTLSQVVGPDDGVLAPDAIGAAPEPGLIILELGHGEVYIARGEPGEAIRVQATFDTAAFTLEQHYESHPAYAWSYRLTFRPRHFISFSTVRAWAGGQAPKLHVSIPPDRLVAIQGRFEKGYSELEMAGLWLTDVDIVSRQGAFHLMASRPTVAPLERLTVDGRMGALLSRTLGNASPRRLELHQTMGGMKADLRGAWVRDAEIEVTMAFGGGSVTLPRNVEILGLEAQFSSLDIPSSELPLPRLDMHIHFDIGDLKVSH